MTLRSLLIYSYISTAFPPFMGKFINAIYPDVLVKVDENAEQSDDGKLLYLTIDDVPYHSQTVLQQLLDLLDRFEAKATFFVISDLVNPETRELLVEAVTKGHQLGNHGKTDCMHAKLSPGLLAEQVEACHSLLTDIYADAGKVYGRDCPLVYRPGCGLLHSRMLTYVHSLGYRLTLGSVYPSDPHQSDVTATVRYLTGRTSVSGGDIVILHDRPWLLDTLTEYLEWCAGHALAVRAVAL
eukprot:GFYU01000413.1.p1 GENE.GFYU01000413.1~~GFYU01000413.1.p1  ORF type:complete len:240 (+),score=33.20 GFYU01000413.1:2-721(+)